MSGRIGILIFYQSVTKADLISKIESYSGKRTLSSSRVQPSASATETSFSFLIKANFILQSNRKQYARAAVSSTFVGTSAASAASGVCRSRLIIVRVDS